MYIVYILYTQSADRTVSSFVDSSVQHREMRLDLIAMNNEILKADLNQARANFARVLELQAVLYILGINNVGRT